MLYLVEYFFFEIGNIKFCDAGRKNGALLAGQACERMMEEERLTAGWEENYG